MHGQRLMNTFMQGQLKSGRLKELPKSRTGAFAKADRYFELRSDNSLELTLYPVSNGNLATHTINEEDF